MKRLGFAFLALMFFAPLALGERSDYPNRVVRLIVTTSAGTSADAGARFCAQKLGEMLGQPFIVENRPGADGIVGIGAVKSAPADGYTILLASNSPLSVNPVVIRDLPYDPVRELKPVHGILSNMNVIVAPGDSKLNTLADLVAASKKSAEGLSMGTSLAGYRLAADWLANLAGIKFNHIPYKGTSQVLTDLIGHVVDVGLVDRGVAGPLLSSGKIKALAVGGEQRHPDSAEVPTVRESGYPGYVSTAWIALFVRSEVPDDVVGTLADAMKKILASDAAKEYAKKTTAQLFPLGPDAMRKFHVEELTRYRRIAEAAGVKPQ